MSALVTCALVVAGVLGYGIGSRTSGKVPAAELPMLAGAVVPEVGWAVAPSETLSDQMFLLGRGRVVLEPAAGVSDTPDVRPGWRFVPGPWDAERSADQVADTLRVDRVERRCDADGTCRITGSGGGDVVTVTSDPLGTVTAFVASRAPQPCAIGAAGERCRSEARSNLPSLQDAEEQAKSVLRAVGARPESFRWESYVDGVHTVKVFATLVVDGTVVPFRWIVDVTGSGVYSVNGFSARMARVDGYEVVGAASAARRSSETLWSVFGPVPVIDPALRRDQQPVGDAAEVTATFAELLERRVRTAAAGTGSSAGSATSADGGAELPRLLSGVRMVTVTAASPTLGLFQTTGGAPLLLPAWMYTSDDGSTWMMPAVSEAHLSTTGRS